ncbi:hypothetical protein [Streptosporangium roseum]|uniref:hypothetical protein n=1 Tax=Streptosporangium roseum TaxID=2001 RepID=UPI0004CCFEE9|nr:hypothetical protein [Streptosporangium roseum]
MIFRGACFLPLLVVALLDLRATTGGDLGFLPAAACAAIVFATMSVYDLVVIDWLILAGLRPRLMTLPGTEGMKEYRDLLGRLKLDFGQITINTVRQARGLPSKAPYVATAYSLTPLPVLITKTGILTSDEQARRETEQARNATPMGREALAWAREHGVTLPLSAEVRRPLSAEVRRRVGQTLLHDDHREVVLTGARGRGYPAVAAGSEAFELTAGRLASSRSTRLPTAASPPLSTRTHFADPEPSPL